jgi:hypothetical protein
VNSGSRPRSATSHEEARATVGTILSEGYRGAGLDQLLVGSADAIVRDLRRCRTMGFDHVMVRHIVGDHQVASAPLASKRSRRACTQHRASTTRPVVRIPVNRDRAVRPILITIPEYAAKQLHNPLRDHRLVRAEEICPTSTANGMSSAA